MCEWDETAVYGTHTLQACKSERPLQGTFITLCKIGKERGMHSDIDLYGAFATHAKNGLRVHYVMNQCFTTCN